jgi:catechol 2,3-dioxygenase-like lactoylglutathione lyase family enzyme
MGRTILGIHHITAIADDPDRNVDFYTSVLGLRLVKITVNFDDPASYHFYYGDAKGHPGSILTFFAWPGARRGRHGNRQVTQTAFAIPKGAGQFWRERLKANAVEFGAATERFGEPVISFTDPDGLALELIESDRSDPSRACTGGGIRSDAAISGFHSATLSETGYERTARLLSETMGFRSAGSEQNRFRYEIAAAGPGGVVDVICAPAGIEGRVAAGAVHHIAWRTPEDVQQLEWRKELIDLGYNLSPVMDRVYFHSIYYREPGGVLFEIATDPPGFTIDEPLNQLGSSLKLPPWFERIRPQIESSLPRLEILRRQGVR